MIFQISLLALIAPLVCATIVLQAPNEIVRSNSPITFSWTSSDTTDPQIFDLILQQVTFHNQYAIANNVPTSQGSITLTIPTVPATDGYTLQAVNISDINDVYSTYGPFPVAAALSALPPGLTTSSGASNAGTTAGSGITAVGISNSVPSAGTPTGTRTTTSGTSRPFNNGANQAASSYTALALSAIAGITFLAL